MHGPHALRKRRYFVMAVGQGGNRKAPATGSACDRQLRITTRRIVRPWLQQSSCRHAVFNVVDHGIRTQITSDVYQNSE